MLIPDQPVLEELKHRLLGHLLASTRDHARRGNLSPGCVRLVDHGELGDCRTICQNILEFRPVDIFSSRNDHVLLVVVHVEIAFFICIA